MPLTLVYCKDPRNTSQIVELVKALPGMVAKHLTCEPGTPGHLLPEEVDVRVQVGHPLDVNTKDLAVIVWANLYPEREQNLDERRYKLALDIKLFDPRLAVNGSVWVLLQPGSYQEWHWATADEVRSDSTLPIIREA